MIFGLMRRWQESHVFRRLGIHLKHDIRGFYGYLFGYQAITSSASLRGYLDYVTAAPRRWK